MVASVSLSQSSAVTHNRPKGLLPRIPLDRFLPREDEPPLPRAHGFFGTLWRDPVSAFIGIRVPTTKPPISDERREALLQQLQPGDIVLVSDNVYPIWQRVSHLTVGGSYTHVLMYEGKVNGQPSVLEANTSDVGPDGVRRTPFEEAISSRMEATIVRPPYQTPEDREAALEYCRRQIGKPYDWHFSLKGDDSFYCSKLAAKALRKMPHPISVATTRAGRVGHSMIAPDSFLKIPGAQRLGENASYRSSINSHWPIAAGALCCGALAIGISHSLGISPILAGAMGTTAGYFGGICLGNGWQTGYFNLYGQPIAKPAAPVPVVPVSLPPRVTQTVGPNH